MCREYKWTIEYVESLSFKDAQKYHDAAAILIAKDRLHELAIVSYPNMKPEKRKDYHKRLKREASKADHVEMISAKEMARRLKHGGFGN